MENNIAYKVSHTSSPKRYEWMQNVHQPLVNSYAFGPLAMINSHLRSASNTNLHVQR